MRRPYVQIHVHLVWSTWDREPLLGEALIGAVHAAIAENARGLGCVPVHVGGTADHVHVLVGLPASLSVSDLVRRLKGASSHLVNHVLAPGLGFRWQGAYGALSISMADFGRCRDYVNDQVAHHSADVDPEWETAFESEPGEGRAL